MNPVLRTIVCGIGYTNFSPKTFAKAIRASPNKIMDAVGDLERMGLVKLVPEFHYGGNIVPASEFARNKMRRWADAWCVGDDKCHATH